MGAFERAERRVFDLWQGAHRVLQFRQQHALLSHLDEPVAASVELERAAVGGEGRAVAHGVALSEGERRAHFKPPVGGRTDGDGVEHGPIAVWRSLAAAGDAARLGAAEDFERRLAEYAGGCGRHGWR